MDDTEDDVRYPSIPYTGNYQSSHGHKLPQRNPSSYSQTIGDDEEEEEVEGEEEEEEVEEEEEEEEEVEEEEEEEEEEEGEEDNGVHREEAEEDEEEDEVDVIEDDDDDTDDEEDEDRIGDGQDDKSKDLYGRRSEIGEKESGRQRKKRKFKNLGYEFAPRVVTPPVTAAITASASVPRPAFGRNLQADWTESASFLLLDAWGDRFVQLGRKSLRSDEWHEVARKVSQASKVMRTDAQCRNRLDTLKKKYKKEKMMAETGEAGSKWVYFKKMDALLSSLAKPGLSCGLDSGEYVFMNGKDYNSSRSNGLDEMRDSPANSESSAHEEDDSDGLPPKRPRSSGGGRGGSSFRLLADSIHKFGEIYEKIENSKRQQMVELEKMRMEFHRDLELQKRKIMERAQAEIAKICQGDDEEFDVSTENTSG